MILVLVYVARSLPAVFMRMIDSSPLASGASGTNIRPCELKSMPKFSSRGGPTGRLPALWASSRTALA
jgi:hypothetical protein